MKGILWVVPVWGTEYVERWLRYGFPSMMLPGNLPALSGMFPVDVVMMTGEADAERLKAACPFKIEVVDVNDPPASTVARRCHNTALGLGRENDLGVILGLADSFYADGTFAEVGRLVAAGKRAVLTQGLNVTAEKMPDILPNEPRELIRLASRHLHPRSRQQVWSNGTFSPGRVASLSMMLWPLGGHGFILRAFHIYPLFLYPRRPVQAAECNIDGWELLGNAVDDLDQDCGWLDDSDRGCLIDLTPSDDSKGSEGSLRKLGVGYGREWVACRHGGKLAPFNIWAAGRKIWMHDGIDRAAWRHVEAESDADLAAVLERADHSGAAASHASTNG